MPTQTAKSGTPSSSISFQALNSSKPLRSSGSAITPPASSSSAPSTISSPLFRFSSSSRHYAVAATLAGEEAEKVANPSKGPGVSFNWALAGRGVVVKDKVFHNLKSPELQNKGATAAESLSGIPVHVRGNVIEGVSEISKSQFSKLLKQVTAHLSSISDVFVHDGAVGSSLKCDAKVRVISDSPSAVLSLSNVLWETPSRAVSHDPCPLTVYIASSISSRTAESIGLGSQSCKGFLAADIERASLILCGKAFWDSKSIKDTLAAVAGPVISARDGLPLSARLVASGDSAVLLFGLEDITKSLSDLPTDAGVILSSEAVAPMFRTVDSSMSSQLKLPAAVILATADSSGSIPSLSQLSPGQAAYHFLAGYQNGKFVPAYNKGPSAVEPLVLAKALLSKLKDNNIPSFLVNLNDGQRPLTGKDLVKLVHSILPKSVQPFESKAGGLRGKYKSFISGKYQELPEEFTF